jgi:hypothetical protein
MAFPIDSSVLSSLIKYFLRASQTTQTLSDLHLIDILVIHTIIPFFRFKVPGDLLDIFDTLMNLLVLVKKILTLRSHSKKCRLFHSHISEGKKNKNEISRPKYRSESCVRSFKLGKDISFICKLATLEQFFISHFQSNDKNRKNLTSIG